MVDINKLKACMALKGYNQRKLTTACINKGYKISQNTVSAKFTGRSPWTIDDADMVIDVLEIHDPAEKAAIFLAKCPTLGTAKS